MMSINNNTTPRARDIDKRFRNGSGGCLYEEERAIERILNQALKDKTWFISKPKRTGNKTGNPIDIPMRNV